MFDGGAADTSTVALSSSLSTMKTEIPTLSVEDIRTERILGTGSFSNVYRVRIRLDKAVTIEHSSHGIQQLDFGSRTFALKCPRRNQPRCDNIDVDDSRSGDTLRRRGLHQLEDYEIENLKLEAKILSEINHPNIIRIRGVVSNSHCPLLGYFFIMDCLRQETLEDRLRIWRGLCFRQRSLSRMKSMFMPSTAAADTAALARSVSRRLKEIALPIVSAMKYLHSKGIVLRDLKPENIGFAEHDGSLRLFDFGLARHEDDVCIRDEIAGSLRYMSRESMMGKSSGRPSDVYSFGLLLWEIVTLERPYESLLLDTKDGSPSPSSSRGTGHKDFASRLIHLVTVENARPGYFRTSPPEPLRRLALDCCDLDPQKRPLFSDIEQCLLEFLQGDSQRKLKNITKRVIRSRSFHHGSHQPARGSHNFQFPNANDDDVSSSETRDVKLFGLCHLMSSRMSDMTSATEYASDSSHGRHTSLTCPNR